METQSVYACMVGVEQFKSYYVVWKPQANDGRFHQHIRLNRTM